MKRFAVLIVSWGMMLSACQSSSAHPSGTSTPTEELFATLAPPTSIPVSPTFPPSDIPTITLEPFPPTATQSAIRITSPFATNPPAQPPPDSVRIYALSFVDPLHGWALGSAYDSKHQVNWAVIFRTDDGGKNWKILPAPDAVFYPSESSPYLPTVNTINFANTYEGWAAGAKWFATHDGGTTWIDEGPSEDVERPISPGENALSLRAGACAEGIMWITCAFTLWSSGDGKTWQPASLSFRAIWAQLYQYGPSSAWIWYMEEENDNLRARLMRTRDGGVSWETLPDLPSLWYGVAIDFIQAVDEQHLWFVTGRYPGACTCGIKAVYMSKDGGETWELRASTEYATQEPAGELALYSGYIQNFTAISTERAFIGTGQGTILGTFDGGRTWRDVIPYELANPCGCSTGPVIFYDEQYGWAITPAGIFRTTDGGDTWENVGMPG